MKKPKYRTLDPDTDIEGISRMLVEVHEPGNRDGNWLQPMWEWSHIHPLTESSALMEIGVWCEKNRIVAAEIFETRENDVGLATRPEWRHLRPEMLDHAQERVKRRKTHDHIRVFVHDFDTEFIDLVNQRGYHREPDADRPLLGFDTSSLPDKIAMHDGFRWVSMDTGWDTWKVHRVLHRGFNHAGEPPPDQAKDREDLLNAPSYRPDLFTAAVAPSGDFATFCGLWLDEPNRYAYVEPVVTDPDYRRRGLGGATVLESIRKSARLGAQVAYVWSDQPFYHAIGFKPVCVYECWSKQL